MRATRCSGGSDLPPAFHRGARHAVMWAGVSILRQSVVALFFPVRHTQPVGANKIVRALATLAVLPLLGLDRLRAILSLARWLGFGRGGRRHRRTTLGLPLPLAGSLVT